MTNALQRERVFVVSGAERARLRRLPFVTAIFVGLATLLTAFRVTKSPSQAVLVAAVMTAFIGAIQWRASRAQLRYVATHSTVVGNDAIVVRDGAVEARVPYTAIAKVFVNLRGNRPASIVIEREGGLRDRMPNYEDLDVLVQLLRSHLPADRIEERRLIHV